MTDAKIDYCEYCTKIAVKFCAIFFWKNFLRLDFKICKMPCVFLVFISEASKDGAKEVK